MVLSQIASHFFQELSFFSRFFFSDLWQITIFNWLYYSVERELTLFKSVFFIFLSILLSLRRDSKIKQFPYFYNPLPHMPILGSSNSAANEDMMSKIMTNWDTFLSDWVENIVRKEKNWSLRTISSFPAMFSKAVCCWCVKMSFYGVKGKRGFP